MALRRVLVLARELGLPTGDPVVVKDGSNLLVHLRPAPVVARAATTTAAVRGPRVADHFRRAIAVSGHLAARGVPVVGDPADAPPGPHLVEGVVVAFAAFVAHDPDWRPDPASFATLLAELHAELRDYPGPLPARGPLDDVDAALALLGGPPELVARRDELVARWPELPVQPLHGDAHAGNLLGTARGPVWNDFEDTWRGPVAWDVATAARSRLLDRAAVVARYPAAGLEFHLALRELMAECWALAARAVAQPR
ncbi:phosphotransferase [Saccharothrix coeruleofusca]|uniref:phosphotransferase n=1 Tax=Saccharothrix coeruleofusca TaxID=33919 RepID=UPI0016707D29|nr:phosphotransferase [Saccharothrix coeruleofusca]